MDLQCLFLVNDLVFKIHQVLKFDLSSGHHTQRTKPVVTKHTFVQTCNVALCIDIAAAITDHLGIWCSAVCKTRFALCCDR